MLFKIVSIIPYFTDVTKYSNSEYPYLVLYPILDRALVDGEADKAVASSIAKCSLNTCCNYIGEGLILQQNDGHDSKALPQTVQHPTPPSCCTFENPACKSVKMNL